jgi:hypothetical protein
MISTAKGQTERPLDGQVLDGLLDRRRLVEDHLDAGVLAEAGGDAGQLLGDPVGDLHRVRVGLLEDVHAQRRPAVGPGDGGGVHRLHLDRGQGAQADRSVRRRDPPLRDLLGGGRRPADLDGQLDVLS